MTFYNLQISWVSSYYTPCQLNYYHLHIRSPLGYPHASTRLQTCSKYRTYHLGTVTYAHTSDSSGHSTPLVDAVVHRGRQIHEAPFHVPGHKRGSSTPPALEEILTDPLRFDLTELQGLDYLSYPDGPILEAQKLAAQCFGAEVTWFLVNGTTVGIHAAVMAMCTGPNDALLLARNAHLSAFNAAVFTGCTPVYVAPEFEHGMAHNVTPEALERGFKEAHKLGLNPKAALVVSPTYFGIMSDITALAEVCHAHGAVLIIDEAHGAHYHLLMDTIPQGPRFSGLASGADLVIQSTHKQLSALTQCAMLHMGRGGRVDPALLSRALQVLQTSSPSYLLMASLDAARAQCQDPAAYAEPQRAAALLETYFGTGSASGGADFKPKLLTPDCLSPSIPIAGLVARDPWRFTVLVDHMGLTGWEAAEILEGQYGVVPELANHAAVVLAVSMGSTTQHAQQLIQALDQLALRQEESLRLRSPSDDQRHQQNQFSSRRAFPRMKLTPRQAFFSTSESVPLSSASGRVSAELLCPYPPGVPAVYPGEIIDPGVLEGLIEVVEKGGKVVGAADASLQTIRVIME